MYESPTAVPTSDLSLPLTLSIQPTFVTFPTNTLVRITPFAGEITVPSVVSKTVEMKRVPWSAAKVAAYGFSGVKNGETAAQAVPFERVAGVKEILGHDCTFLLDANTIKAVAAQSFLQQLKWERNLIYLIPPIKESMIRFRNLRSAPRFRMSSHLFGGSALE